MLECSSDEDLLVQEMDSAHAGVCRAQLRLFSMIVRVDRSELWRDWGAHDMAHWLYKLVHEYGWTIDRRDDGTMRWFRPDGTCYRAGPGPPDRAVETVDDSEAVDATDVEAVQSVDALDAAGAERSDRTSLLRLGAFRPVGVTDDARPLLSRARSPDTS